MIGRKEISVFFEIIGFYVFIMSDNFKKFDPASCEAPIKNDENFSEGLDIKTRLTPFTNADLKPAYMVTSSCNGCGTCIDVCPAQCIESVRVPVFIRQDDCLHCGTCASVCDKHSIVKTVRL